MCFFFFFLPQFNKMIFPMAKYSLWHSQNGYFFYLQKSPPWHLILTRLWLGLRMALAYGYENLYVQSFRFVRLGNLWSMNQWCRIVFDVCWRGRSFVAEHISESSPCSTKHNILWWGWCCCCQTVSLLVLCFYYMLNMTNLHVFWH